MYFLQHSSIILEYKITHIQVRDGNPHPSLIFSIIQTVEYRTTRAALHPLHT